MEDLLKIIKDVIDADNNIRNLLINDIMTFGELGMNEISLEISRKIKRKTNMEIRPNQIAPLLLKVYGFGFQRYMSEYDKHQLEATDFFNKDSELNYSCPDKSNQRMIHVSRTLDELHNTGNTKNKYWNDFSKRGSQIIRGKIEEIYGKDGARKFDYYLDYEIIESLQVGLNTTLNQIYRKDSEEVQLLNNAIRKLDDEVRNFGKQQDNTSSLESLFK